MTTSRVLGLLAALSLPLLTIPSAPAAHASVSADVVVADMAFGPSRVTVRVGETVTWTFRDAVSHTATSDDGFFDSGRASGGAVRTIRFRSAGTFAYHCELHPMMVGRVSVPVAVTDLGDDGWRLRWLAGDGPRNRAYDVQVRRNGATAWKYLRKATTAAGARYDPGKGLWQVRARTLKGTRMSGWSPVVALS